MSSQNPYNVPHERYAEFHKKTSPSVGSVELWQVLAFPGLRFVEMPVQSVEENRLTKQSMAVGGNPSIVKYALWLSCVSKIAHCEIAKLYWSCG